VIVLGIDTATPATAVALLDSGAPGGAGVRRHDPAPGERPGHTAQLLALAHEQLAGAGMTFADVDRIAVGLGPGGFTGLRIGVATARALAWASSAQIVGLSSLRALAAGATAPPGRGVLAVIDARRGEVFAAGFRGAEQVLAPRALAPAQIRAVAGGRWFAVGDGAVRFRAELEGAGCHVPADRSPQHRIGAGALCRLALEARHGMALELIVPHYLRPPDATRTHPR